MVGAAGYRKTRTRVPDDLHARRRRPPGHRPRVPAAQAPPQGAEVLHVVRHGARLLPRGGRPALHGRAAAGGRHARAAPAGQGQGPRRRPRRGPRPVRQRPPLRGLVAARGGAQRRVLQRDERHLPRQARTPRAAEAVAHRGARAARPWRSGAGTAALPAAGLDGRRRTGRPGRRVPRVGRLALCASRPGVRGPDPRRGPAPSVRPAAGPGRRQALLGLLRGGRQAAAGR